jgi:hypothetical protein
VKLLPPLQKKELVLKLNVSREKESKMSVLKLIAKNKNVFV